MTGDQVLGAAEDELHPLVQPAQYGQRQGTGHDGGAPHVVLHGQHALGGLHGVAAGVEGDPLAHQCGRHRRLGILAGIEIQLQHHGLAIAATADLVETDPTRLLQRLSLEDAMADAIRCQLGEEGCRLHRQLQRSQLLRRGIGHLPHPAPAEPASLQLLPVLLGRGGPLQGHFRLGRLQPLGEGPLLLPFPVTGQDHLLDPLAAQAPRRLLDVQQGGGGHQMDHHAIGAMGEQCPLSPLGRCKLSAQPNVHALTSCNQRAMVLRPWPLAPVAQRSLPDF